MSHTECKNKVKFEKVSTSSNDENSFTKQPKLKDLNSSLSCLEFFFVQAISKLPIINLPFLLTWAFNKNSNLNLKAYAKSILIWNLIYAAIIIFLFLTLTFIKYHFDINVYFQYLKNALKLYAQRIQINGFPC